MTRACLLLLVTVWGADGGRQELREELRRDLAWVVPPGWLPRDVRIGDVAAGDPQDPFAAVVVIHVPSSHPDQPIDIDFLRRALERFPTTKKTLAAAMVGTCSDGQLRFACEELEIRYPDRLDVAYAWVDGRRGWGFSARYSMPREREEELLPLVRHLVGWKGTRVIHE
jgi:hypothetical protein